MTIERIDEQIGVQTNEWTDEQTNKRIGVQTNEQIDVQTNLFYKFSKTAIYKVNFKCYLA